MISCRDRYGRLRRGASIIEALMVVLMISATASAAVFWMSSPVSVDPARQTAQSFVAAMRDARDLAMKKQSPVTVILNQTSNPARWMFTSAAGVNGPAKQWDLALEENAKVDGTTLPIRFDPSGNASYFGEWKISGTGGYHVTLQPMGARVTMKSLD